MSFPPISQIVQNQIPNVLNVGCSNDNLLAIGANGDIDPYTTNANSTQLLRAMACNGRMCKSLREHEPIKIQDVENYVNRTANHTLPGNRLSLVSANITHFLANNPSKQPRVLIFPCNIAYQREDGGWDESNAWRNHRTGIVLETITRVLNENKVFEQPEYFTNLLDSKSKDVAVDKVVHVQLPENNFSLNHLFIFPLHEGFSSADSLFSQYQKASQKLDKVDKDAHVVVIPPATSRQYEKLVQPAQKLCAQMSPLLSVGSGVSVVCYPGGPDYSALLQAGLKEKEIKRMATALFSPPLQHYGLRGDETLWKVLEKNLREIELPPTATEAKRLIKKEIRKITAYDFDTLQVENDKLTCKALDKYAEDPRQTWVSLSFWKETGIPTLLERYRKLVTSWNNR